MKTYRVEYKKKGSSYERVSFTVEARNETDAINRAMSFIGWPRHDECVNCREISV